MTDPKRLPSFYLRVINGTFCGWTEHEREGYTEYVPASSLDVPRCRTCEHYHVARDLGECWAHAGHDGGKAGVPNDGSGYCHNHPDAKKG
jgi:hypothetical protein